MVHRFRRWLAFLRAKAGGYFWLPCHHCGRPWGGHERGRTLLTSQLGGFATCAHPDCVRQVEALNAAFMARRGTVAARPAGVPYWRIAA